MSSPFVSVVHIGFESASYQVNEGESIGLTLLKTGAVTTFTVDYTVTFVSDRSYETVIGSLTAASTSAVIPYLAVDDSVVVGDREVVAVVSSSTPQVQLSLSNATILIIEDDDGIKISYIL